MMGVRGNILRKKTGPFLVLLFLYTNMKDWAKSSTCQYICFIFYTNKKLRLKSELRHVTKSIPRPTS